MIKKNYLYRKCGVQLSDINQESLPEQIDLFDFADNGLVLESSQLMKVVDQVNRRFPKAISVATTGFDKLWKSKADRTSKRYTTG